MDAANASTGAKEGTGEDDAGFTDSVMCGLIENFQKNGEINEDEAFFLKTRLKKVFMQHAAAKATEASMDRKCRLVESDILSEKIAVEKALIDEADESSTLQRAVDTRLSIQKELEVAEQKETMARFELFELKRVHEELTNNLAAMKQQNKQLVEPILTHLREEIKSLNEQLVQTEEAHEKESAQEKYLTDRIEELDQLLEERSAAIDAKAETLQSAEMEPGRLERQISSIENALNSMDTENRSFARKIKMFDSEQESQARRRIETEKQRKTILEKLELNRQTLEEREQDTATVKSNLEKAKALNHDLITTRVEVNVRRRDIDSKLRHLNDQFALATKDYEILKRQIKKKRSVMDSSKEILPILEAQLQDQEILLKNHLEEKAHKKREIQKMKDEIDSQVNRLLQQEGLEKDKKRDLEQTINEVDELEGEVVHWLAEGKRQGKLIAVLSAQRDVKGRETVRIEAKEKEGKQHVKIKELIILDLTKRCNELSNRLKEFSALYEVVKNERNKYVNLIQSSAQALAEMREKIRILHNEVEILGNERMAKDMALTKEKNAHLQAQNQRDSLRQDLNRLLSEYRSKQSVVEQQIQEIDKLNVVINNLEKDMLILKSRYEHAVEERNVTGVQLIDRNDELCILYERSNQQQEALRVGEIETLKKDEELRLIRLQTEELKRHYLNAKKRLPELEKHRQRISELEEQLRSERKKTIELSNKLEDPKNSERWRPLDGQDPDMEQLDAKIKILEARLDQKREQQLEKELILEEVTALAEKLRTQAVSKRDAAKVLAQELNGLQSKIKDVTKKMLATVSELSMYQATALRLQQEKMHREKTLEEAKWRFDHGEVPSEEALRDYNRDERKRLMQIESAMRREEELQMVQPMNMTKTAAEPRPTAYIPDDIGIPKPYGGMAPFKPSEQGATMRHIKQPQPKAIEI